MKSRAIVLLIFSVFILSCVEKQTEFFPLRELTSLETVSADDKAYTIKKEYFVIANPPKDQSSIKAAVEAYNKRTLTKEEIEKSDTLFRLFYRETKFTPRDYAESNKGFFHHDHIDFHARDILVRVKWSKEIEPEEYRFFSKDELP